MDFPDLVGRTIGEADDMLKKGFNGYKLNIVMYQSPKSGNNDNNQRLSTKRIIRQKHMDQHNVELVVSEFIEYIEGNK